MSVKVVSLNVEHDKHLESVKTFLEREQSDIVCLMEVCEDNLDEILSAYPHRRFAPNFRLQNERKVGVVVASSAPFDVAESFYCDGLGAIDLPYLGTGTHRPVVVIVEQDGMTLGATHFTWTPDMSVTAKQSSDLFRLMTRLSGREMVLLGDFNIPRGNVNYEILASRYRDNIPESVVTTIDPKLHRANQTKDGSLSVVVDYVLSTPSYGVGEVKVESNVSDHCALVCTISLV